MNLFRSPHSNRTLRPVQEVLSYYFFNFTIQGQIGLLKNAPTWPRSFTLEGNKSTMVPHGRTWVRRSHRRGFIFFFIIFFNCLQYCCYFSDTDTETCGATEFEVTGTRDPRGRSCQASRQGRGRKALRGETARTLVKTHELASPPFSHLEE